MSGEAGAYRALGRRFSAERMAENYLFRPPYPAEVYELLLELMRGHPQVLLDAGCGTGKITLGLIDRIDRADAVDPSEAMLRVARSLRLATSRIGGQSRSALTESLLAAAFSGTLIWP